MPFMWEGKLNRSMTGILIYSVAIHLFLKSTLNLFTVNLRWSQANSNMTS